MKKIKTHFMKLCIVFIAAITIVIPLDAAIKQGSWSYAGWGYSGVIGWSMPGGKDEIYTRTAVAYNSPYGPCLYFDYRTGTSYVGAPVYNNCLNGTAVIQKSISVYGVSGSYSEHSHRHQSAPWKELYTNPY